MSKTATNPPDTGAPVLDMTDLGALLTPDTSAAALANLDRVRTWASDATNQVARLEATRPALLLDGTDTAIDALDREIQAARRRLDRLTAAADRLTELAHELDVEERRTAARAMIAKAKDGIEKYPDMLQQYNDAACRIRDLIAMTTDINHTVMTARSLAEDIGLDAAEWNTLTTPAGTFSTPDQNVIDRVYLGPVTDRNQLRADQRHLSDEDIMSNYEDRSRAIPGRYMIDLASPGFRRSICLPAPWSNEWIVDQK